MIKYLVGSLIVLMASLMACKYEYFVLSVILGLVSVSLAYYLGFVLGFEQMRKLALNAVLGGKNE